MSAADLTRAVVSAQANALEADCAESGWSESDREAWRVLHRLAASVALRLPVAPWECE